MDNLTKLMSKLSVNKEHIDEDVISVQYLFKNMSLNTTNDDDLSGLIDQMSTLKIENNEMEIIMKDKTIIKIYLPCHIQYQTPMEVVKIINCF